MAQADANTLPSISPHERQPAGILLHLLSALMQIPVLEKFLHHLPNVLDDLAGGSVVELLFLTMTRQRFIIFAAVAIVSIMFAGPFLARLRVDPKLRRALLLFPVLFLAALWFGYPFLRYFSPWMRLFTVAALAAGAATVVMPIWRHEYRTPLMTQFLTLTTLAGVLILAAPARDGRLQLRFGDRFVTRMGVKESAEPAEPVILSLPGPTVIIFSDGTPPSPKKPSLEPAEPPIEALADPPEPASPAVEPETAGTKPCPPVGMPTPPPDWQVEVQKGDTLWDLAVQYGTTVDELVRLNGPFYTSLWERPDCIFPRWKLKVYEPGITP